jgi:hypothetical protein
MTSKTSVLPGDRLSALKARQTLKMAASAHAYVRGSTAKFYQWLDQQKRGALPEGPPAGSAAIATSAISDPRGMMP